MYIIGSTYDVADVNAPLAEMWVESMKAEKEATNVSGNMVNYIAIPTIMKAKIRLKF